MRFDNIIQKLGCPARNMNFDALVEAACPTTSTTSTTTCPLPDVPSGFAATGDENSRVIVWNEVGNALKYELERDANGGGGGDFFPIATMQRGDLLQFEDTYPAVEFTPCYRIRAWNLCGYSDWIVTCANQPPTTTTTTSTSTTSTSTSTTLATTSTTTCQLPENPTAITLVDTGTLRKLQWMPGFFADSLEVWRSIDGGPYIPIAYIDPTETEFIDPYDGLGVPCYRIRVKNDCGYTAFTSPLCGVAHTTTSTSTTSTTSTTTTLATTTTTTQCACAVPDSVTAVPQMTTNTLPSGIAFASTNSSNAWKAFDRSTSTGWSWFPVISSEFSIGYFFSAPVRVVRIAFDFVDGNGSFDEWTFEASNDGANWQTLYTQTLLDPPASYYDLTNCYNFRYYRIVVTEYSGDETSLLSEFYMYDCASILATTSTSSTTSTTTTCPLPDPPTGLTATYDADLGGYNLSWTPGAGASSQQIWRSAEYGGYIPVTEIGDGTTSSYFVPSLPSTTEQPICFKVRSKNTCGASAYALVCPGALSTTSSSTSAPVTTTTTTPDAETYCSEQVEAGYRCITLGEIVDGNFQWICYCCPPGEVPLQDENGHVYCSDGSTTHSL